MTARCMSPTSASARPFQVWDKSCALVYRTSGGLSSLSGSRNLRPAPAELPLAVE
jgi:hypothetical protein